MKKALAMTLALLLLVGCAAALAEGNVLVMVNFPAEVPSDTREFVRQHMEYGEVLLVPGFSEVIAALTGGRADMSIMAAYTGSYAVQCNQELGMQALPILPMNFHMILRSADTALYESVNQALKQLVAAGVLEARYQEQVINFREEDAEQADVLDKGNYEKTLRVGVSGDMPPMDFINAAGQPAGYNVAVLYEMEKLLKMNIETVIVPSEARYQALLSEKIDVFFWHTGYVEMPEEIIATEVYARDDACLVTRSEFQ